MILEKIREIRGYIFADKENFTLEHRLFLSSITYGILISFLGAVVAIFIATSHIAVYITLLLASLLIVIYYFARFKRITKPFVIPIIVLSFTGISTIWVFGGGINGSNIMLGFVVLILAMIVVPDKKKKYVLLLFLALLIIIYLIQFYLPHLINDNSSVTRRWVNSIITAAFSSFFIYLILSYLLRNYTIERKRAEESEKKYRLIVDNSGEGIGFVNEKEYFEIINPAAERIFGVENGGLIGKNLKEFLSEDQYNNILSQTGIRKQGQSSNYEFILTRPDGEKRDILITAVPQFDDNNKFIGTHGIFRDFTDRKKAELALKTHQVKLDEALAEANRFSEIMDNLPAYIYIKSTSYQYIYANKKTLELFGRTKGNLHGSCDTDFFNQETVDRIRAIDNKVFEKGIISSTEVNAQSTANDRTDYWEIKYPLYTDQGNIYGLCGISTDITKIKQAEKTLAESEKRLAQLNADKDRFISILAHDLKSPFSALLGLSEELSENINQFNIREIEKLAQTIHLSAQNIFKLLEDILMWAKSQQDRNNFNPQDVDLSTVCFDIMEALKPVAAAKNIRINCLTGIINVFADRDMLSTIMRNLISNAIKFTNRQGTININATNNKSEVTVSISDNGIGITPENITKLFDISQIITTKGTEKETGSGLGLLICKEFIEKHGGRIWVESESGKGSVFSFSIPSK